MLCLVPIKSRSFGRKLSRQYLLALLSVFPFGCCILPLLDPLGGPDFLTKYYLLRLTPPGTNRSEVQALIMKKGWTGGKFYDTQSFNEIPEAQKPISITLSHTEFLNMPTWRYAEWVFDEEGNVITVEITEFSIFL